VVSSQQLMAAYCRDVASIGKGCKSAGLFTSRRNSGPAVEI